MYTTQIDHMNLHQIANSGQCFRWQQINDNTYKIPAFGKELTISQDGNTFILSCDENEWNSLWKKYFDVDTDTDYDEVENIIMESNDDFLKAAYQFGSGIRILRQDLLEVIISFIISKNNNIMRTKKFIEKLCDDFDGDFPNCDEILEMNLFDKQLGYMNDHIKAASGWYKLYSYGVKQVYGLSYQKAKEQLMRVKGISNKVADYICLFSLHHLDAFPKDIYIKRIIHREYDGELPEWVNSKYAGLFQQYLFYFETHKMATN